MNRIFSIALVLVALALPATAKETFGPVAIGLSTNRVTAATTNTTAGTAFFIGDQTTVNFLLTCYSTNAAVGVGDAAATFTLRFAGSQDGVTYFENGTNWDVMYITAQTNSTATFRAFDASAVRYFKPSKMLLPTTNLVIYPTATYWYK